MPGTSGTRTWYIAVLVLGTSRPSTPFVWKQYCWILPCQDRAQLSRSYHNIDTWTDHMTVWYSAHRSFSRMCIIYMYMLPRGWCACRIWMICAFRSPYYSSMIRKKMVHNFLSPGCDLVMVRSVWSVRLSTCWSIGYAWSVHVSQPTDDLYHLGQEGHGMICPSDVWTLTPGLNVHSCAYSASGSVSFVRSRVHINRNMYPPTSVRHTQCPCRFFLRREYKQALLLSSY